MPAKSNLGLPGGAAFFHAMPAAIPNLAAGVKWVAGAASNARRGLPHVHALLILSDPQTGAPIGVLEAGYLTGLRTAAITLLAARHLARRDSRRLALVGCGLQARTHLDALRSEFPIESVALAGRTPESVRRFADTARADGLAADTYADANAALEAADIVVSSVPAAPGLAGFLDAAALPAGALAAMVDLGRSWRAETTGAFDRSFTDDARQSRELSANNPTFAAMRFTGDLGGLLDGSVPGRCRARERLAFLFPGVALADLVAGHLVLARAGGR
jgi:ornithine cyclodeaminase/alanine dehydrogenase